MQVKVKRNMIRGWGSIRLLPSENYQASYIGLDKKRHFAPTTFLLKKDAESFLSQKRKEIETGTWLKDSTISKITFKEYAKKIIAERDLSINTRILYFEELKRYVYKELGDMDISKIKLYDIKRWYYTMPHQKEATLQKVYMIVKMIFNSAILDELITDNPCKLKNKQPKRKCNIVPISVNEIETIVKNMPYNLGMIVLITFYCALRCGEVLELRIDDFNFKTDCIKINKAVIFVKGKPMVSKPKTFSSIRDVFIPPHIVPKIKEYINSLPTQNMDQLLFYSKNNTHIGKKVLIKYFKSALEKIHITNFRFHDLRHMGATYAALSGATIKELMERLGHSTPAMAIHYQHVVKGRGRTVAEKMSAQYISDINN